MMTFARWNIARRVAVGALGIHLLSVAGDLRAGNAAKIDPFFAQWDRADSPGAAVVVVKDGAVVYLHGYGCADLEHRIPITPQTLFDVASVAKQFTGLSMAMLVQQGKLSLDDDIHKHLPDVPDFGKPITINQLIHHTSGLRDWPETLALSDMEMEAPITLDTILEMVRRQRELDFAPGAEEQYSNTGYNLLAATVAKVTGQSFRTWTYRNLFQPLEMKHPLVCDNPAEVIVNRASSYAPDGTNRFHRVVSQLAAQGSSSLFISAEDNSRREFPYDAGVRHKFLRGSLQGASGFCPSKLRGRHQPVVSRHQSPKVDRAGIHARPPPGLRWRLLERRTSRRHSPRNPRQKPGGVLAFGALDPSAAHGCG